MKLHISTDTILLKFTGTDLQASDPTQR